VFSITFNGMELAFTNVMRHFWLALVLSTMWTPLRSATLERLSLSDMAVKSTAIVRAKIVGSSTQVSGSVIYTHYKLQVSEQVKGPAVSELVVFGGSANGMEQYFPGSPRFNPGEEYVFFLWTSKAGLTQVIGLTQGIFQVGTRGIGNPVVTRPASHELMLDRTTGRAVKDQTLVMQWDDLKSQIAGALAGQGAGQQ
jgi:hypothetical protein